MATSTLASGFEAASQRFDAACGRPDAEAALHAVFEAVAWAGALRDRFRKEGRDVYPELKAFWFVRGVVLHSGADALDWLVAIPGAELDTLVLGVSKLDSQTVWRGVWRPVEKRSREEGEAEYGKHLKGKDIASTLRTLLERLRADAIVHRDHFMHRGLVGRADA
jgi:hypothetical protein